ncbi:Retinol dehydrogenase 13 [Galemys pyrenaicus]|uniref:Retinol dehydrogenase 13 n=1 Tax=Galemys pyrenaicus TaxID=202257 RepID=A0A8J6AFT8_GALPY|nr:Retinol dehydrogenase 13 [Galemys pyrenaicus]
MPAPGPAQPPQPPTYPRHVAARSPDAQTRGQGPRDEHPDLRAAADGNEPFPSLLRPSKSRPVRPAPPLSGSPASARLGAVRTWGVGRELAGRGGRRVCRELWPAMNRYLLPLSVLGTAVGGGVLLKRSASRRCLPGVGSVPVLTAPAGAPAGQGLMLLMPSRDYVTGGACPSKATIPGKTVIVTGANTGIGKQTALELARRGGNIILACRDLEKCEAAAKHIRRETLNHRVNARQLDLASLTSVREFARKVIAGGLRDAGPGPGGARQLGGQCVQGLPPCAGRHAAAIRDMERVSCCAGGVVCPTPWCCGTRAGPATGRRAGPPVPQGGPAPHGVALRPTVPRRGRPGTWHRAHAEWLCGRLEHTHVCQTRTAVQRALQRTEPRALQRWTAGGHTAAPSPTARPVAG